MNQREQIEAFAAIVERDQKARLKRQGLDCEANLINARTTIKEGRTYTKVDVGGSGKYMVEHSTGIIFGIKGYGKVHRGHSYGTLDTVDLFGWGSFRASPPNVGDEEYFRRLRKAKLAEHEANVRAGAKLVS